MKNELLSSAELTFWNHSSRSHRAGINKTRSQKLLKSHPLGTAGRRGKAYTVFLCNLKGICLEVCTIC